MITTKLFLEELKKQMQGKSNYEANMEYNVGRYKYSIIIKCDIQGVTYYATNELPKAYTNLSTLKRMITRG